VIDRQIRSIIRL